MTSVSARMILAGVMVAAILAVVFFVGRRPPVEEVAQTAQSQPVAQALEIPASTIRDEFQRSLAIFEFKKAALSGPERGREIFYYKCWFCHNEFAQGAPPLNGVFKREKLLSGRTADEAGIKEEIRNGGAGMAAYKYALSEADLSDLVSYLKEGCCWNSDSPPPNPRYRALLGE